MRESARVSVKPHARGGQALHRRFREYGTSDSFRALVSARRAPPGLSEGENAVAPWARAQIAARTRSARRVPTADRSSPCHPPPVEQHRSNIRVEGVRRRARYARSAKGPRRTQQPWCVHGRRARGPQRLVRDVPLAIMTRIVVTSARAPSTRALRSNVTSTRTLSPRPREARRVASVRVRVRSVASRVSSAFFSFRLKSRQTLS